MLEPSTRYVSMYTIRYLTFVHGMILESELRIMRLSGYGHKKVVVSNSIAHACNFRPFRVMGCKLSVERGVAKHEASVAAARDTWKRRVRGAADQWTAHSTLAAAKHASAQGMPEPPAQFFAAQQRLDDFFHAHGERLVCAPGSSSLRRAPRWMRCT